MPSLSSPARTSSSAKSLFSSPVLPSLLARSPMVLLTANLVLRGPVAELRDVVVAEAVVVPVALDAVDDLYVFPHLELVYSLRTVT